MKLRRTKAEKAGFPSILLRVNQPASSGGREEIRTPDCLTTIHAFQACPFGHSGTLPTATSPYFLKLIISTHAL